MSKISTYFFIWNHSFMNKIWPENLRFFTFECLFVRSKKILYTNPKLACAICAMTQNVLYEVSTVPEKTSIEKCTTLNDPVNIFYRIKKKWKETLFVWGKRKYPLQVRPLLQFKIFDCRLQKWNLQKSSCDDGVKIELRFVLA